MADSKEASTTESPNRGHSPSHWLLFLILLLAAPGLAAQTEPPASSAYTAALLVPT